VGVIPEDWEVTTLGEICTFENGDRGRNYPSPGSFTQSGVPFINAGHLVEGRIDVSEMNYITPEVYKRLGSGKVQVGDILFCLRGSLGKFGIVREGFGKGAIASSLVIVRPRATTISRDYLGFYFNSALCAEMIDTWSGGAAQPNLGARDLARFYITFPPTIDEQRAIAEVLSDVDALLAALEHLIAKKRAIKQGAMQQLLTGKTRLPGFTGEWKIQPFDQVFRKQNAKSYQIPTSEYLEHGVYPVIDQGKALIVAYSDLSKKLYHCPLDGVIIFGDHTRIA
jgi:type I restriction enzyme S subunit